MGLDQKQKREKVQELLEKISSTEEVYNLFNEIGYKDHVKDQSYQRDVEDLGLKQKAADKISNIYTVLNYEDKLPVLLIETDSLSKTHTDYVTERLTGKLRDVLLIFTEDYSELEFVFPDYESEGVPGEYDLKTTRLRIDTRNVFYSDADALSKAWLEEDKKWTHIWNAWEEAFSIDKVTEQFFEDYQEQFFHIREKVLEQIDDVHEAHEFTLQFMNRLMFVYFVDKKGWLEGEEGESYVQWLWEKYAQQGGLRDESEDSFYNEWLTELFHKAFNNKFTGNTELPEEVNRSFQRAPYLNGGLFRENSLTKLDIELEDDLIDEIIHNFFERYNFTIKEDSPVDKEVAVDPQMIGYVYESLSNVAEQLEDIDKDSRKEFGIFYTPKEEVYFMVKRSLTEYLNNNTGLSKTQIYKLVFAETDEEKKEARKAFTAEELEEVKYTLQDMKSVDPACGSGAFLVGIIDVISEIFEQVEKKQGSNLNMFEAKKEIIQKSIYGVDVKDWAINASELRLFLQLLIETDVPKEEIQRKALLPNLRANLRVGDSLVQDIDGIFFDLRENQLEGLTKSHMEEIQKEKSKFFEDRSKSKYDGIADIQTDEIKFFRRAIDDKIEELEEKLEEGNGKQQTLNGETKEPSTQEKRQITKQKKQARDRIEKLEELKDDIAQEKDKMPMLWEVAFAEVFNNNGGFDVLIGNPPYVRQEGIAPPNMNPDEVTRQDEKDYKNKLIESVQNRMPQVDKISKRSDLYIYFYFHGLSLINEDGTFCFITSNSWLDVGYGKELQKFLCKHVPIKGIYNNKNNRSFEHADVNTVISLFGAPNFETKSFSNGMTIETNEWPETSNEAHFITFKKPYREAVNAENMIALENDQHYDNGIQLDRSSFQLYNTQALRSIQITQKNLLEDGWNYPDNFDGEAFKEGDYDGNKWGGKFLRAPDVFFSVIEKNQGSIKRLGDQVEIGRGIRTGANKFFYAPNRNFEVEEQGNTLVLIDEETGEEKFEISEQYWKHEVEGEMKPNYVLKSSKNFEQIKFNIDDLEIGSSLRYLILIDEDEELDENIKEYIEWGEEEGHGSGDGWYDIHSSVCSGDLLPVQSVDRQHAYWLPESKTWIDQRLQWIELEDEEYREALAGLLNSSYGILSMELNGRTGLGQGALDVTTWDHGSILLPKVEEVDKETREKISEALDKIGSRELEDTFKEIGLDRNRPIREQEPSPLPDRKELDDIVFDALGLSEGERKEVYWSVAELVKARLDKAESV